ncbi:MAG: hypothetical protein HOY69_33720 [Streptomyces sp.]|nr:hypothetical protein [Streptomyces sp.]
MTSSLDRLPREPGDLARRVAALEAALDRLRAAVPDAGDGLIAPQDADTTRWPQTTSGLWTGISRCQTIARPRRLRMVVATAATGGGAGTVRVSIGSTVWSPVITVPQILDYTAALPAGTSLGIPVSITVEALRTSGAGTVYAQTLLIGWTD